MNDIDHRARYAAGLARVLDRIYDHLDASWDGPLASRGLLVREMRMIGLYYDDPAVVKESELRSKAGVWLPRAVDVADGPVHVTSVAGGKYAVLRHKAPYAGMGAAYQWPQRLDAVLASF